MLESNERGNGLTIEFSTNEQINIGNIVSIIFEDKTRYFEVVNIKTDFSNGVKPILIVKAKNYGYYDLIKNIDIRNIMYKPVEFVIDPDIIAQLRKESRYC